MGSFFINSCVVIVFSQVFYYSSGRVSRDDIGLGDASQALQNVLGNAGPYIWGVGLLASAQSTTVTGTLAGQYVLEGFWNLKVAPWKRLLGTRVIAIIPSFFVAVLANSQLDMVGEYLNAIQSIQLPFVLIPILKIAADRRVMGKFTSPLALQIIYWIVGVAVVGMNAYSLVHFAQTLPLGPMMYVLFCGVGLTYIVFIFLLCFHKSKV
ncbi:hypothetical protein CONCODRAFT_3097 [Conidiobolus coronatus NRRL 28638]|uniref:Natural resistance-associated macrophage protein n=1 Tax=Conidiobolus coronatus (strain ATCC 28846 / CBS 209.66 / NRRL 28638) TaxID=796925 RepID=A0A137PFT7_CONC2|nr:hypothetical protein CONCODRAFT_3097 [Conidiobolus coronatus NRRL 28638]|eukprot:KXN73858.1 hypothetical protein CONCODRAFT_3097 [Conidiobolus coronatus NRRL 28638]